MFRNCAEILPNISQYFDISSKSSRRDNVRDNRVAGVDCPFQSRPAPRLRFIALLCLDFESVFHLSSVKRESKIIRKIPVIAMYLLKIAPFNLVFRDVDVRN